MKASIITMTKTYNYGATMQAYALQTYVESLGINCDIIDHMGFEGEHKKIKLTDLSKSNLLKIPYKLSLDCGYKSFELFYRQYIHLTRRYASDDELMNNPPNSDFFISGSDQVFNPRDPKLHKFLLDFVPQGKKRISYAASVGDPCIPNEKKEYYRRQLKTFDAISVREEQGKRIISELTDKKIFQNVDPVFLLDKEEWRRVEKPVNLDKDRYLLCYMIYKPEWFNQWIKKYARKNQLKIVNVGLNGFTKQHTDKFIRSAGPSEFLWLFDNATQVVSSSFHGNAFAILFGKPLISIPDPKRPDRLDNLLSEFDIKDCELFENNADIQPLKYTSSNVTKKIQKFRTDARAYFDTVL